MESKDYLFEYCHGTVKKGATDILHRMGRMNYTNSQNVRPKMLKYLLVHCEISNNWSYLPNLTCSLKLAMVSVFLYSTTERNFKTGMSRFLSGMYSYQCAILATTQALKLHFWFGVQKRGNSHQNEYSYEWFDKHLPIAFPPGLS